MELVIFLKLVKKDKKALYNGYLAMDKISIYVTNMEPVLSFKLVNKKELFSFYSVIEQILIYVMNIKPVLS